MSVRKSLWSSTYSHIDFESDLLQMRKIIEGYAQLNLLLSHIEFEEVPKRFGSFYEASKILKGLRKVNKKRTISSARLTLQSPEEVPRRWHMDLREITDADEDRIIEIWQKSGAFLHDRTAFDQWPYPDETATSVLASNLAALRSQHQWFWNLIWFHYARFSKSDVFTVNLGEEDISKRPSLMLIEGHFELQEVKFVPEYLADFTDYDSDQIAAEQEPGPTAT